MGRHSFPNWILANPAFAKPEPSLAPLLLALEFHAGDLINERVRIGITLVVIVLSMRTSSMGDFGVFTVQSSRCFGKTEHPRWLFLDQLCSALL